MPLPIPPREEAPRAPLIRAPDAIPRATVHKRNRNEKVLDSKTSLIIEITDPVIKKVCTKTGSIKNICTNNTNLGLALVMLPSKKADGTGTRLGTVWRRLFNHILKFGMYKDADDNPLIGKTSKIYLNPSKASYNMAYLGDSTEEMWSKFHTKRGAKKNESVKVCVGVGKIRNEE